ncbi:hypothetical protein [Winogradskyella sp.]|uniref:hypothetical protein n=1 Tax=Winogradskyella sp. TaxID=1883156 RepID=UPI003BAB9C1A
MLNLPTGFGKTYEVLQYLLRHQDEGRLFYFVTNLKKNLPHEELRGFFREQGFENEFDKKVIFIDGTSEKVIDNIVKVELPDDVKRWDETKVLKKKATLVSNYRKSKRKSQQQTEANKIVTEEIRVELEPAFRSKLINYIERRVSFQGKYASPRAKLGWIEREAPWIIELYPSVMSIKKKIFFLSVDKFFAKNVTLIQPSYYFHDHKTIENALVFLDEFDASKAPLLNSIIESGLRRRINLVALFQQLYTTFTTLQFPANLRQESKSRRQSLTKDQNKRLISDIIDHLGQKADELAVQFRLEAPFKTVDPDNKRNFIFHDFQYQTIIREGAKYIRLEYDEANQTNNIYFEPREGKKGQSLLTMLAKLRAYLQFFSKGVWIIAMNYCELKDEQGSQDFPLESALKTVLDLFNLSTLQVNYILEIIANHESKAESDGLPKSNYLREHSFYMNGFRYYDFVDGDTHDLTSRIYMCSFDLTPEKLILKLAQKANVIGISATATIDTPIGNYDLDFISQRLGDNYRSVNDDEYNSLKNRFLELTKGYDQLSIKAQLVQCNEDLETAMEIFEDQSFGNQLLEELGVNNKSNHFFIRRYFRIARAYKYFLLNEEIKSFLYLGNALPKSYYGDGFRKDILEKMFAFILSKCGKQDIFKANEKPFVVIDSDQFDEKKAGFINDLTEGKKRFIVSTYQTLGAGQNLQYPAPQNLQTIRTNERDRHTLEKDIDAIYCERPTHLLVNKYDKSITEKDLVKNIFEVEFLSEAGEISQDQMWHEIRAGFQLVSGRERQKSNQDLRENNLYSKNSFAQHISKVIIQAIGRISRTNQKSPVIHVMAHNKLNGLLRKGHDGRQIYLHEYEALLDCCDEPKDCNYEEAFYNKAGRNNKRAYHLIRSMLNKEFEENNREYWQQLREFVLKNPRTEHLSEIPLPFHPYYFELPPETKTYSYNETNRTFESTDDYIKGVSDYNCRLSSLMQNHELKTFFKSTGYATQFGEGKYILTPCAYQSIYKGMLGETAGKFILEKYAYMDLYHLDLEEYELFDFKTSEGVYVDFKHWRINSHVDPDEEYRIIHEKIQKTGAQKVIIVNILGSSIYKPKKQGRILEIPYLIDESTNEVDISIIRDIQDFVTS